MKQAIAGVTPPSMKEATIMTVWPSVAAMKLGPFPVGLWLGKLYSLQVGVYVFTFGNLICLMSIPIALVLYAKRIGPVVATRYRVTNKRVMVERGLGAREYKSIALNHFDAIDIEVKPGQDWYDAGDLVFRLGNVERFKLEGVSRPAAFQQVCMKARDGFVGVQEALGQ